MNESAYEMLVCPTCHQKLEWTASSATCIACGVTYEVADDIPLLVVHRDSHKQRQAEFFDSADYEFEVARPHGTPRFYRWLIEEKFRRSVGSIERLLTGAYVVTSCGGSGMDAEYLARRGARVFLTDISLGAAKRARERAVRAGVTIIPVVADAEALPFADRAVSVGFVHDGLHHLEHPEKGLAELTRVADRAVSVNEPANASLTDVAVRIGLSDVEEEAGNRIERFDVGWVTDHVRRAGFRVIRAERYGMVYRHEPGRVSRILSLPLLFQLATAVIRLFNLLASSLGNKLTVQATRSDSS